MKRVDMAVSVVFFLMGGWVLWQATMLPTFSVFGPGPEFMPNVAGTLLILLSVVLFVNSWRNGRALPEDFIPNRAGVFRILVIAIVLFLYVALLEVVGYKALTFAYATAMLLALGRYRWYLSLGLAAVLTFAFYQAFVVVLGVPVPRGIFGI